eukprot:g52883.t1
MSRGSRQPWKGKVGDQRDKTDRQRVATYRSDLECKVLNQSVTLRLAKSNHTIGSAADRLSLHLVTTKRCGNISTESAVFESEGGSSHEFLDRNEWTTLGPGSIDSGQIDVDIESFCNVCKNHHRPMLGNEMLLQAAN